MAINPAHHIVIVGTGSGGLEVARRLARAAVRVTVIDRRNHDRYLPARNILWAAGIAASSTAEQA